MAAAIKGYKMILIMPDNSSAERKAAMTAYGAELILVTQEEGMEGARDLAERMEPKAVARCWTSSPTATTLKRTTPPPARKSGARPRAPSPISSAPWAPPAPSWAFALPERAEPGVQIIGLQPMEGSAIPGIRRWPAGIPAEDLRRRVDRIVDMAQSEAEDTTRRLAREEGIFCGVSSGGAVAACCACPKKLKTR
jgi:cysteine synthase B